MPTTRSLLRTFAAISVMLMADVLVAKIVWGEQYCSNFTKSPCFRSSRWQTASTTKRAPVAASLKSEVVRMFFKAGSMSSSGADPVFGQKTQVAPYVLRGPHPAPFVHVHETHLVAFGREDLGDRVPHQARTDDGYVSADRAKQYLLYEAYSILVPYFKALTASCRISLLRPVFEINVRIAMAI